MKQSVLLKNFTKKIIFILLIVSSISLYGQNCTVNAGVLNITICENDALVLTGNNPSPIIGTVLWTQISGPAVVINSPTSSSTTISGYTGGNTYIFRYSATCGDGVSAHQDKVVNVQPITIANAGGNIASCPNNLGTLSITANTPQNAGETGYWEIVGDNNAGVIINFPDLPTSTITLPAESCGVTTLQWVIEGEEYAPGQRCRTTSQITVTNYGGAKPVSAGPDQNLSNCYTTTQTTNLTGTYGGCGLNGQSGQWTFVSGPNTPTISNPGSNTTPVSNLVEGTYTFRWTVNGPCASGNDLVVITVPPATQDVTTLPGGDEDIFFCDNTITEVTLVAQTPLYAGETVQWTQISGDTGAVIVSPANPTTLVTNISDSGDPYKFRYTLTNTNTGCIFTKDYNVQYNGAVRTIAANNGNDIVGSCNATVFTIPLTVTGTGVNQYRIVSGPASSPLAPFPTAIQSVGNSLTLTLTASGNYNVEFIRSQNGTLPVGCDYGFDTLSILVSGAPTPSNAGSDVSLPCGDTSTTLSGVVTDDGMHFWSQLSGPNQATIADNFAVNTQVTGLVPGTYVFQYITKGGGATCGFSIATVTIYVSDSDLNNVEAGTNQVVCANSQVNLAATPVDEGEIGEWSQISGPNTIIFSDLNDPNAVATGFATNLSSYQLQWTVSYLHPGPLCNAAASDTVTILTNNSSAASNSDAGPDACYPTGTTTFNLSGNTPGNFETGTWTVIPASGVIFADVNDPNTLVTVPGNGTYTFTWAIETFARLCEPNKSSVSVTIADTPPAANAGPDQEICGTTITMAASGSSGATGTWTRISGLGNYTISDEHDPNAVFTFNYSGYYIFRWTVDAAVCGSAFDDINLTIGIPPHQALAGPDQNVCNNTTVTMAGSAYDSFFETGQWSVLTGAPNNPTIVDPSNPNTVINGLVAGTYTFRWTITAKSVFLCTGTFDDITVVVTPTANAGADQSYCDVTSVALMANKNSTGTWSLTSTTGNPADVVISQSPPNSYIANATVVPGNSYVFTYTTSTTTFPDSSTCPGSSDSVNIQVFSGASIDPDAGPDQTLCISDVSGVTTLQGNTPPVDVAVSVWRFVDQPAGSVAVITTPSAPLTTVTGLTVPGLYILEWVFESTSCRTLSDIVRIEMNAEPSAANAGPDDTVACQTTYQTAAVPPTVGIGTWSFASPADDPSGGAVVIDSPNSPVTTLSNITTLGTYRLTWTVTNGPFTSPSLCQPSSDTVEITFNDVPPSVADAGPDQELCGVNFATMDAAQVTSGLGTWTQVSGPNTANIASPNLRNSLMLGLIPGTYEFLWTVTTLNSNGCISEDSVLVTIYENPSTADAGPNQTIPQFTPVIMNAETPSVGNGIWTQISGPTIVGFTNETSPTTTVTGTVSGTYVLEWTVSNGNCTVSSDTITIIILSVADLELIKTVTPTTGSAGNIVTFNIQIFNNNSLGGTVTATGVSVRDYIPSGINIVPGSANYAGQYNLGDNTITWNNLTIPVGNKVTLTFQGTIIAAGSYVNTAEIIASNQFDPDSTPNNQNPAEDDMDDAAVVLDVADLSLQKTVSPTNVSINDNVIFTIRVTNSGPNNATGITVSDKLPPGYTYVSDNGAGKYNSTTGIWNVGNLNNGNSLALQITAKVNVATSANYSNIAEIQTAHQLDPDSTPGNGLLEDDMASANIILKFADLELTKTVTPTAAAAGEQVDFFINVFNRGPGNATGVSVQDIIPVGYTLIPGSVSNNGTYQSATATLEWKNLFIGNNSVLVLSFKALVNPLGDYHNTAQVTASDLPDPDSTPNNNISSEDDQDDAEITFIGPSADLSLVKNVVAGNTSPVVGSVISFELVITNDGPNDATGVQITDLLPSGYEYVNYSSSAGLYNNTTGIWSVGTVDSGVSESLILDVKVLPAGDYFNITQVTASNLPDPDSTPNNDDGDQSEDDEANAVITPIQQSADLSLTKSVSNTTPLVGSLVTFQVITTNSGPQDTAHVTVTDLLPSGYTFVSFNATSGTYDSTTGLWTLDILESSESETLQIIASVNPAGNYINKVEVTSSDIPDPDSTPNNGITIEDDYAEVSTIPIPQSSDLTLTKTVNNAAPIVGSEVVFEIVVTNNGPQDNNGIQVTDILPSGYTFNGFRISTGTYDSVTGVWTVGNLVNGDSETLQLLATVNTAGNYTNTAEITASSLPDPDSTPNNGVTTEDDYAEATTVPVPQSADLSLIKIVNNNTPLVGSQVTFTLEVSNAGPQNTAGVTVNDLLPNGYTYVSYNTTSGAYDPVTGIWNTGSIGLLNSHILQITATVNATGDYTNIAEILSSALPDPDSTPNNGIPTEDDYAAVSTAPIPQSADLSLTKTVDNPTPLVGSLVTFSLQIENTGPQDANTVAVKDLLPSGYSFVLYSATTGSYDPVTGIWNVGNIPVTNSYTLQITAVVNPFGNYTNNAEITASSQPDPDSTPNNAVTTEDDYAEVSTIPIPQSADLSLTKSVSNSTPLVGSQVTFNVQIYNMGPQETDAVVVTDLLPSGYTFVSYTTTAGTYDSSTGFWIIGNMPIATYHTLQITAVVNAAGNYTNSAEISSSSQPDPDSTPDNGITTEDDYSEITTTPIQLSSDLSLTKTVNNPTPLVGSQVTFEIVATNNGPQDNTNVQVTDLLPSGYTFNNFTATTGTYSASTGLWNIGNLVNGKSETLQIIAIVNSAGDYLNIAEISSANLTDPDSTPNNTVPAEDDYASVSTTPIQQSSDLSLTKTVNNPTPLVGSQVTFEIVVTNNGPQDNTNVQITDLLPSGYTFNNFTVSTGTYNASTGLWNIGNLVNGKSETLQIIAIVNSAGDYLNIAEISSANLPDPDSTPNNGVPAEDDYASVSTTPVQQSSDLSLTKTVNNPTPLVGSQVTFEIVATNNGPQDNTNVQVTDLLTSGYTFNSFTATTGTYNASTGLWNIGNLVNGKSETLQISAVVNQTGNYTNSAEVTASSLPDPNSTPNNGIPLENDYAEASTSPVSALADLSLTKTLIGNNLSPIFGSTVTFEITVQNSGPQTATGVQVIDQLPGGLQYVVYSSTTGQYFDTTGIWTIGTIASGDSESLLITAIVNNSGNYVNTAEIYASNEQDPDSTPNNNVNGEDDISSVTLTPVSAIADLSIEKLVVNNNVTPDVGSQISFSITVTNSGPSVATGVTIRDVLPSGYEYVFYNATSGSYNNISGIWNPGIILPGNSHTLLINANVKTPTSTADEYLNIAEIMTSDQFDPDSTPGNGVATEDDYDSISVTPVIVMADLSINKTVLNGTTPMDVGSTVIFTVTVTNDGPGDASGVSVKDLLPPGFTYLTSSPTSGLYNYATGIWNVGIVQNGANQSLDIYTRVNPPTGTAGEYTNETEIISSNLPDPDSTPNNGVKTEDDYDSLQINVSIADLSLEKTVSNKNANVGEVINFTLQLNNDGPSAASGVAVEDIIPLGYYNINSINNGGIFSNNKIKWVDLTVPVGGITLSYQAAVASPHGLDSDDYLNITQVTASNQFDPDSKPNNDNGDQSEDDEDSEFINIPSTDIAITKEVDKTDVPMGSSIIFTITAENIGNLTATNVEVQDILPKGYTLDSFTVTSGMYNSTTGNWTIPAVNAGSSQTLTITAKVIDFNDYLNTAHLVKMDQIDTNSANNQDSATVSPNCLKIYNEFSPNDDGQNDTFYIDCITQYPDNQLQVFNRWGNLVYYKKGYNNTWDGKENGSAKTLPEGTYFYILDLGNGSAKTSGWLYLK